jgi:hypothetical protein
VLVAVGLKIEAYASLVRHPAGLIVLLAAGLAATLLFRPKPLVIAVMAAALIALVLRLHPLVLGAAVGVGAFVVLMTAFFALATVLHARQSVRRPG